YILESYALADSVAVGPPRVAVDQGAHERRDRVHFLGRVALVAAVLDREVAHSRPTEWPRALDVLTLESCLGLQAALVEDLGRERADVRMKAPGLGKEKALLGRHGGRPIEQMGQGRPFR